MAYKRIFKNICGNLSIHHLDNEKNILYAREYYLNTNGGGLKAEHYYYKGNIAIMSIIYFRDCKIKSILNYKNNSCNQLPTLVIFNSDGNIYKQNYDYANSKKDHEYFDND